jgi:ribosomal protein L32
MGMGIWGCGTYPYFRGRNTYLPTILKIPTRVTRQSVSQLKMSQTLTFCCGGYNAQQVFIIPNERCWKPIFFDQTFCQIFFFG